VEVWLSSEPATSRATSHKDKKTHLIYLGKKREKRAKEYSANYKKLLAIVEAMTLLNMKLLKEDASL
jgi:hypothetical protein